MKSFLQHVRDGDYAGMPPERPMSDEELERYHKHYHAHVNPEDVEALSAANTQDLKELPGAAGEAAHKRLHAVIADIVNGKKSNIQEGALGALLKGLLKSGTKTAAKSGVEAAEKTGATVARAAFETPVARNADVIYNQLTRASKDVEKRVLDTHTPEQLRALTGQLAQGRDKLSGYISGTGWDHWQIGTSGTKRGGNITDKNYLSIKNLHVPENLQKFQKGLPDLHARMKSLGDQFGVGFQFKTPQTASGAMTHPDTLVAHHNLPDSSFSRSLDATMKKWAKDSGLEVAQRPGMETGVDVDGKSFGQLVSDEMAKAPEGSTVSLSKTAQAVRDRYSKIR